jgi:uncharacterized protein YkwD
MRSFPSGLVLVFAAAMAAGQCAAAPDPSVDPPQPSTIVESGLTTDGLEQALVERTNADRADFGLAPLQDDPEMLLIARERAASQLGNAPLAHNDAAGASLLAILFARDGVAYTTGGENLARWHLDQPDLVNQVERALMLSPPHRENILSPQFSSMAVGVAVSDSQVVFAETYRAFAPGT